MLIQSDAAEVAAIPRPLSVREPGRADADGSGSPDLGRSALGRPDGSDSTAGDGETGRSVTRRVAAILSTFADGDERTTPEIARLTGLPMSTAYRLIAELVATSFLERTASGGYRVGSALPMPPARDEPQGTLHERALPALDDLSRAINCRSRFGTLDHFDVVYVESSAGRRPPAELRETDRHPAHPTALGRALLAFSPAPLVDQLLAKGLDAFTAHTTTSPERFRRAIMAVRQTHVALACGEFETDQCAVAMPVFGPAGGVIAAFELAVSDLAHDLPRSLAALEIASRSLSRELAAPHEPVRRYAPVARTADLQTAAILGAFRQRAIGRV